MAGNERLFLGNDQAVVEHAPLVLSDEDHIAAKQILERAIREALLHRTS
ncbi:MAG: hypothetical protein ACP5NU_03930 [Methanomicrobiales archaeon]|jgi:hypothetical protein|nr:hypothetical protein [Burkholderiaceae bacterium]NLH25347.1 hypothetical protein [Methanomicrobiales archaeon]HNB03746.1 hypothetical protein [Methanoregulaceae archaeon]HNI42326.1 hypothetical protein [Methanoregulaceae archaeon]HNJ80341.1 hypothetical protein [Methanoregulaceae archaeon]